MIDSSQRGKKRRERTPQIALDDLALAVSPSKGTVVPTALTRGASRGDFARNGHIDSATPRSPLLPTLPTADGGGTPTTKKAKRSKKERKNASHHGHEDARRQSDGKNRTRRKKERREKTK